MGIVGGFDYLGKRYPKLPYKIIKAIDNDPYCTRIYNHNFVTKCEIQDVKELDANTLEDFDLLGKIFKRRMPGRLSISRLCRRPNTP